MFGDEFRVGARRNCLRLASCAHLKRFPFAAASPRNIPLSNRNIDMFDFVFHRQGEIIFPVTCARDEARSRAAEQARERKQHRAATYPPIFLLT